MFADFTKKNITLISFKSLYLCKSLDTSHKLARSMVIEFHSNSTYHSLFLGYFKSQ